MRNGASIGKYVNTILKSACYDLYDVFWTNVIKCPPPYYRDPTKNEINNCILYLQQQIDLIKPAVIICFGRYAKYVFENSLVSTKAIVILTYHPTYLKRYASLEKRNFEEKRIAELLKANV